MNPTEPKWKSLVVETTSPVFSPEQCQKIIDRGIRTPGQILESYVDKLVSKGSNY